MPQFRTFIRSCSSLASGRSCDKQLQAARYAERLGMRFKEESGGVLHTELLRNANSFALWPLLHAAQPCFGTDSWPNEIPTPQGWLERRQVESATAELEAQGHRMLVRNKREPWGQTVSRFLAPEGLLIGITCTPSMQDKDKLS